MGRDGIADHRPGWICCPQATARLRRILLAIWLAYAAVYAAVYFHTYFGNMFIHFLRLPEKAPRVWSWLDQLF